MQRFRVRFDPGERLILGAGAETVGGRSAGLRAAPAFAVEMGLLLRGERPAPGWDVHWKRNHEIAHLRLHPTAGTGGAAVDGVLYRGIFLRQSREGTLTLPMTPPVALPLPFDVGVLAEIGHVHARCRPRRAVRPSTSASFTARCSPISGARASRAAGSRSASAGATRSGCSATRRARWTRDHRVSPMSTLAVALHSERADGLAAGGVRAEASHRWSSVRGWERAYRVDADAEVTPFAANDRPIALFAIASADERPGPAAPRDAGDGGRAVLTAASLTSSRGQAVAVSAPASIVPDRTP